MYSEDTPTHTLEEDSSSWWSAKVMKWMKDTFYHKAVGKAASIDHLGDEVGSILRRG